MRDSENGPIMVILSAAEDLDGHARFSASPRMTWIHSPPRSCQVVNRLSAESYSGEIRWTTCHGNAFRLKSVRRAAGYLGADALFFSSSSPERSLSAASDCAAEGALAAASSRAERAPAAVPSLSGIPGN